MIWLTGLSGAVRSSAAVRLEQAPHGSGVHTFVLDGDNLRHGLNRGRGFADADRAENVPRVAKPMAEAGLVAIVAMISPFRAERRLAREPMEAGECVEVFVDTPLAVCEAHDPKGRYPGSPAR